MSKSSETDIAIVIACYNRPLSLQRLLNSITVSDFRDSGNIQLYISIDFSGNSDCKIIAEGFKWDHGSKTLIVHPANLGLKEHIYSCAGLSIKHDGIIVLEDDLFVSPFFYQYAKHAYGFYKDDPGVAGIGLYNYRFCEFSLTPFEPIDDGYDNYFIQVPCSWGQLWTKEQWKQYRIFISQPNDKHLEDLLPGAVKEWPVSSSWKREYFTYLLHTNKYFVHPRISLTTNFGDVGQHLGETVSVWQSALLLSSKKFSFSRSDNSSSIYDMYFELHQDSYNRLMRTDLDISFDLNGMKSLDQIKSKWLVSCKKCVMPEMKFQVSLYPYENNIILGLIAKESDEQYFSLGETKHFNDVKQFDRSAADVNRIFFNADILALPFVKKVYDSDNYKAGSILLKPFRIMKAILRRLSLSKS